MPWILISIYINTSSNPFNQFYHVYPSPDPSWNRLSKVIQVSLSLATSRGYIICRKSDKNSCVTDEKMIAGEWGSTFFHHCTAGQLLESHRNDGTNVGKVYRKEGCEAIQPSDIHFRWVEAALVGVCCFRYSQHQKQLNLTQKVQLE